jgi:hypothetical protein
MWSVDYKYRALVGIMHPDLISKELEQLSVSDAYESIKNLRLVCKSSKERCDERIIQSFLSKIIPQPSIEDYMGLDFLKRLFEEEHVYVVEEPTKCVCRFGSTICMPGRFRNNTLNIYFMQWFLNDVVTKKFTFQDGTNIGNSECTDILALNDEILVLMTSDKFMVIVNMNDSSMKMYRVKVTANGSVLTTLDAEWSRPCLLLKKNEIEFVLYHRFSYFLFAYNNGDLIQKSVTNTLFYRQIAGSDEDIHRVTIMTNPRNGKKYMVFLIENYATVTKIIICDEFNVVFETDLRIALNTIDNNSNGFTFQFDHADVISVNYDDEVYLIFHLAYGRLFRFDIRKIIFTGDSLDLSAPLYESQLQNGLLHSFESTSGTEVVVYNSVNMPYGREYNELNIWNFQVLSKSRASIVPIYNFPNLVDIVRENEDGTIEQIEESLASKIFFISDKHILLCKEVVNEEGDVLFLRVERRIR